MVWRIILLTLGLCYHKGSGGRSVRLPYSSTFGSWVLVTLGTSTINQIISMIKESKIDELSASWNGLRISCFLACHWAELSVRCEAAVATQTLDPTNLNKAVKITNREEIDVFSSKIIHSWTKNMLLGNNMHVMTYTLKWVMDSACLTAWVS